MPVEIREVIVRARIREDETSSARRPPRREPRPGMNDLLVQECVEQVLRILRDKRSR